MDFSPEEIEEFKNEAIELLDEAEKHLLSLEKGVEFSKTYDAVFRVFHSIKGGAGMLGLEKLQSHMHQIENHYQQCKPLKSLSKEAISYFLKAVDIARQIFSGNDVVFEYNLPNTSTNPEQTKKIEPAQQNLKHSNAEFELLSSHIKVMIIDDEQDIIDNLSDILKKNGFHTCSYASPDIAIDEIKKEKPDVVLTDIKMGSVSGFDVLKNAHAKDPELPVVFVSGFITKELLIKSISYGVFGAIEKPFDELKIIEICRNESQRYRLTKLVNSLTHFVYYQFSELENYWKEKGGTALSEMMRAEFRMLIEARRQLKSLQKIEEK